MTVCGSGGDTGERPPPLSSRHPDGILYAAILFFIIIIYFLNSVTSLLPFSAHTVNKRPAAFACISVTPPRSPSLSPRLLLPLSLPLSLRPAAAQRREQAVSLAL